jgi:hypothetical protein
VDRIDLATDRDQWWAVVNTVMNLQGSYNSGNFLSGSATVGFARTRLRGVSTLGLWDEILYATELYINTLTGLKSDAALRLKKS